MMISFCITNHHFAVEIYQAGMACIDLTRLEICCCVSTGYN
eukprot:UN08942